jgi:hypothetical protein
MMDCTELLMVVPRRKHEPPELCTQHSLSWHRDTCCNRALVARQQQVAFALQGHRFWQRCKHGAVLALPRTCLRRTSAVEAHRSRPTEELMKAREDPSPEMLANQGSAHHVSRVPEEPKWGEAFATHYSRPAGMSELYLHGR